MNNPYFPVQSSILSGPALVEKVLSKYALPTPVECRLFVHGLNDVYVVKCESSVNYLRISGHKWRTRRDIEEEIDLLNDLDSRDIPVTVPIGTKDGEYLQTLRAHEGTRYAVLFPDAGGEIHDTSNREQTQMLGKIVGRMHGVLDKLEKKYDRSPIDPGRLLVGPVDRICRFLNHRKGDCDYLRKVAGELKSRMDKLPGTKPVYGICHGDLRADNVRFDKDGRPTLFDFDCFGHGWRLHDLGAYVYDMLFSQQSNTQKLAWREHFSHFLAGYLEERELRQEELNTLNVFIVSRYIWEMAAQVTTSEYKGRAVISDEFFDSCLDLIQKTVKDFKIIE